jgi:hypothetical protein
MNMNTLSVTFLAALLAGCAAGQPQPQKSAAPYTRAEKTQLTACIGLTDTARAIAQRKLTQEPIEIVKAYYATQPNAGLTVPTVDKVYADTFTHWWDYTVSFFRECAENLAGVAGTRGDLAAYCMQNGMIAGIAQEFRAAGKPKPDAYSQFQGMGTTPREIVDRVYGKSASRAEEQLAEWNNCMDPITG